MGPAEFGCARYIVASPSKARQALHVVVRTGGYWQGTIRQERPGS